MRALEKDRTRRYASATDLAADLHRHLNHEPVVASPPSASYRVAKFVRRNRGPVIAAGLVIVALIAGIAGTTWQAVVATQERDRADQARVTEAEQRRLAEIEARKTEIIATFAQEMLSSVDPGVAGGLDKTLMKMILDNAAGRIERDLHDEPEIEAQIRKTIGVTYQALGEYVRALPHLEKALAIRKRLLGDDHEDTLASMYDMGSLLTVMNSYELAEPYLRDAVDGRRRVLGKEHPLTVVAAGDLSWVRQQMGAHTDVDCLLWESLQLIVKGEFSSNQYQAEMEAKINTLRKLWSSGQHDAARVLIRECTTQFVEMPVINARLYDAITGFALQRVDEGDFDVAEPLLLEAIVGHRRVLGDEHPLTLNSINAMGTMLDRMGRNEDAESYYREALESRRCVLGHGHPDTLQSIDSLGSLLRHTGKFTESETLLLEVYTRLRNDIHANPQEVREKCTQDIIERLIDLYITWHQVEPDAGHDAQAAQWRAKLPTTQPAAATPPTTQDVSE